jgi:hypothetical protein
VVEKVGFGEEEGSVAGQGQVWMILRASAFGVGSEIEIGLEWRRFGSGFFAREG